MRLSEAMMLGDSLRTRNEATFLDMTSNPPCGCAIGGAILAVGGRSRFERNSLWPWLVETSQHHSSFSHESVIGCGSWKNQPSFANVMDGNCTFEQLVDYVRSIEPSCGICCRFDCQGHPEATDAEPAHSLNSGVAR